MSRWAGPHPGSEKYRNMTDVERLLAEVKQLEREKQRWEMRALAAERTLDTIREMLEVARAAQL